MRAIKLDGCLTDPEPGMDSGQATVRNVRSKCRCSCVLQFTFRRAVSCVLHRPPSQVIHCTVLSFRHSPLARVASVEKTTVFHIPTQGKGSGSNPGGGGEIFERLAISSVSHRSTAPRTQATGRQRDLDSLLRPLAVFLPAADEQSRHFKSVASDETREFDQF